MKFSLETLISVMNKLSAHIFTFPIRLVFA